MRGPRHILRDVVVLTLPLAALSVYVVLAAAASFYNAEIANFAGYPTRALRVGQFKQMLNNAVNPVLTFGRHGGYLPDQNPQEHEVRFLDLRVGGRSLDRLDSDLPRSGTEWVDAEVMEWDPARARALQIAAMAPEQAARVAADPASFTAQVPWPVKVEARHRGQRMENFFWNERSWKLKTGKYGMLDGLRTINLTMLDGRIDNHLAFFAAELGHVPAPRAWIVHLYLNLQSQGLYLQEEQVDESLMRRLGHMPGDIFYGEVFVPDEPKLGTDDIFMNPFLWEKKDLNNKYDEEFRPHLTHLLDLVNDDDPASWRELWRILDRPSWVRFFALVTFQGDQHMNHSHNHKLYFNPLTGRFIPIPWNARLNLQHDPTAVESMANRLYRKLVRDPEFLDDVHEVLQRDFLDADVTGALLEEIDRIGTTWTGTSLQPEAFAVYLRQTADNVRLRRDNLQALTAQASAAFQTQSSDGVTRLGVHARALTSLQLESVELSAAADGVRLFEDRDRDGRVSDGDRELPCRAEGGRLSIEGGSRLFVGRDLTAPYRAARGAPASFQGHREFTRLAFLTSPYLLTADGEAPVVQDLRVTRRPGGPAVPVRRGPPDGFVADATLHPWQQAPAPPAREHVLAGVVELRETLIVGPEDSLRIEPGTRLRLGPGVSILSRARVELRDVTIERLTPDLPWGVFALQDQGAAGSRLEDCHFSGGSIDRIDFVDYYALLSVHNADHVVIRGGEFSNNVLGDDTVRFGACHDLRIDGVTIRGANGDAIDCDLSSGEIVDTLIEQPFNDGVDLMTCSVNVTRLRVLGAGDKGISMGEGAFPRVEDAHLIGCVIGIAVKDGSLPEVIGSEIRDCEVGVAGYDKNWRYEGGGRGVLRGCVLAGNGVDVRLDEVSELTLEDCDTDGRFTVPQDGIERLQVRGGRHGPRP